jgi:hypothetical protein
VDPRVAFAEPNLLLTTAVLPGDPNVDPNGDGVWRRGSWGQDHADLWGLETSGWGEVWAERDALWSDPARVGGGGVVVAIVDTGVDYDHPDLAVNVWRDGAGNPGADFVDVDTAALTADGWALDPEEDYRVADSDPRDRHGHGTLVAGVVAAPADNGEGIAGVAWRARVMPVRAGFVVRQPQSGTPVGLLEADDVAAAVVWAAEAGADVLNLSFGTGRVSNAIAMALDHAFGLGALAVAAAGNGRLEDLGFPAGYPGVVAVTAVEPGGERAAFANWGRDVDLAAPGVDVLSLRAANGLLGTGGGTVGERYLRASGTSLAAPHVAGAAALLLSAFPAAGADEVVRRLVAAGDALPPAIPSRSGRQPLAGGRLMLRRAFEAEPGPHAVVLTLRVDYDPAAGGNGDGVIEPGETAPLLVVLENVWRAAGPVSARLAAEDPFLIVQQDLEYLADFPPDLQRAVPFRIEAHQETPPRHPVRLRLELRAAGFAQNLPLELTLHEPVPFPVAVDTAEEVNFSAAVASDAGGDCVAVWLLQDLERDETRLDARLFDAHGTPAGDRFPLVIAAAPSAYVTEPAVARAAAGPFVAAWRRYVPDPDEQFLIEARLFAAGGAPASPVLPVSRDPAVPQQQPRVAIDAAGRVAVVWEAFPGSSGSQVLLRRYDAEGRPLGGQVQVNDLPGSHSTGDAAFAPDGSLLVVWRYFEGRGRIHALARRFGADGAPSGPSFQVSEEPGGFALNPAVAASPGGGFAVIWDHCEGLGELCSIRGRVLAVSGAPLTPELVIAPYDGTEPWDADVAADDQGRFAAAWASCASQGILLTDCLVSVRAFAASGAPLGAPYRFARPDFMFRPSVAAAPGGFTLVWEEFNHAPDGIFGAHFAVPVAAAECDAAEPASLCLGGGRFQLTATWRDHQGATGVAKAVPLTADSGAFWFFRPDNVEVVAKVLDGRAVNGHFWVFLGSLSNVEYSLAVTDTETGITRSLYNPAGRLASQADTRALPASPDAPAVRAASPRAAAEAAAAVPLNLLGGRFSAEIEWRTPDGTTGSAVGVPLGDRSGTFWFFRPGNVEVIVKMLDGRAVNGYFWVFFGALSNVDYTLTVTDGATGAQRRYRNLQGQLASRADTTAFGP